MKHWIVTAGLVLALGAFAAAQDTKPTGTQQSPNEPNAVRPTKKHVHGNKAKAAGSDVGRGAKAAGHDVKTGHPVEAGKSIGEGTGRGAKDVAQGTATETKKAGHSVKKGVKKATGTDEKKPETTPPPPQI